MARPQTHTYNSRKQSNFQFYIFFSTTGSQKFKEDIEQASTTVGGEMRHFR